MCVSVCVSVQRTFCSTCGINVKKKIYQYIHRPFQHRFIISFNHFVVPVLYAILQTVVLQVRKTHCVHVTSTELDPVLPSGLPSFFLVHIQQGFGNFPWSVLT